MSVEFTDNSVKIKSSLNSSITSFAHEQGGELITAIRNNSRADTGQTKGSYEYRVVSNGGETTIYVGSNYKNAIWEEYGTGEYALNNDGRKGGWVYHSAKDDKYYHTVGKKPKRPIYNAINTMRPKILRALETKMKQWGRG